MKVNTLAIRLSMGGETQKDIAERAGISRVTMNAILTKGAGSMASILKIAEALGVEPETIIHDDEKK